MLSRYSRKETMQLQPAYYLWQLHKANNADHRFTAKSVTEARIWQKRTIHALEKILGFQGTQPVRPQPKIIETIDKGDYIRQKTLIRTTMYSLMPVYLLIPKSAPKPNKTVLAFHGHGYGVKDIIGLGEDGHEREDPDGYQKDFAVELCKHGMTVAAPEISCFGERTTDFSYLNKLLGQMEPTTCMHAAALANHIGFTILGFRIYEMKRLIDYLCSLPECEKSQIGAMGISGGGMLTFFLTALERRIKACVVSGYFCTFKDSILAMHHCQCNFVPRLGDFGEIYDLAGLIAPRPMLVEAGSYDPIFPMTAVKKSVHKAKSIYRVFNVMKNLKTDYFQGRHQISGAKAYDFLLQNLS
jgi:dienelactone hydrolase